MRLLQSWHCPRVPSLIVGRPFQGRRSARLKASPYTGNEMASLCLVYADTDAGPLARSRTNALAARGESPGVAPRPVRRPGVPNAAAALGAPPRWQAATTENIGQYLREEQRSQHR